MPMQLDPSSGIPIFQQLVNHVKIRIASRVLKPGGALVIECADFSMACEQFLKESVAGSTANTLKKIYGDPAHRNPSVHPKWGYTSVSLKSLMLACGLEGVELHARSGMGMPQSNADNRIRMVGIKPTV